MRPHHLDDDTIEVTLSLIDAGGAPVSGGGINSVTVEVRRGQPVTLGLEDGAAVSVEWTEVGG